MLVKMFGIWVDPERVLMVTSNALDSSSSFLVFDDGKSRSVVGFYDQVAEQVNAAIEDLPKNRPFRVIQKAPANEAEFEKMLDAEPEAITIMKDEARERLDGIIDSAKEMIAATGIDVSAGGGSLLMAIQKLIDFRRALDVRLLDDLFDLACRASVLAESPEKLAPGSEWHNRLLTLRARYRDLRVKPAPYAGTALSDAEKKILLGVGSDLPRCKGTVFGAQCMLKEGHHDVCVPMPEPLEKLGSAEHEIERARESLQRAKATRERRDSGRQASELAMQIAGRVWCDKEMTSVVMDPNAALRIAVIIDEVLGDTVKPDIALPGCD